MSNQTHTPGPWRVNGASVWSDAGYVAELSSPRGPDERDANARLIAAAPELLAELKQCALEAEEAPNLIFHNFPKTEELFLKASKRTLALIAKAEGR